MVVGVKLSGGLGSQLFQYCAAKNIALLRGDDLVLFDKDLENFDLKVFGIEPHVEDGFFFKLLKEDEGIYTPVLKTIGVNLKKKNVILEGGFRNPRYFEENEKQILEELKWVKKLGKKSTELKKIIEKSRNPVAVFMNKNIPLDTYSDAWDFLVEKFPGAKFFCFCDNVKWCEQNLGGFDYFIDVNNIDSFYLASLCKHFIIDDSDFCWWVAYLGQKKNSEVIRIIGRNEKSGLWLNEWNTIIDEYTKEL